MGLDRTIRFAGDPPTWEAIQIHLARVGVDAALRMIDGLPAFPNEQPEAGWKELRLGTAAGIVTLRRAPNFFSCVVWGNADDALRSMWNRLCWACATAGEGTLETDAGHLSANEFAQSLGLFPA